MAYSSGSANSFDDLRTALVNACVENGWTWADGILSKGSSFVRPYVSATTTTTEGPGLLIQGGTGKAGAVLTDASGIIPRLGRPGASSKFEVIAWPVSYSIHIFTNPDEVFLLVRFNVDRFHWLAFGVSDVSGLPGIGLWLAANTSRGYRTSTSTNSGYQISATSGAAGEVLSNGSASNGGAFFWQPDRHTDLNTLCDTIHAGIDVAGWNGAGTQVAANAFNAIYPAAPHIGRAPSLWNQESPLLPIQGCVWRASSKCSLVVDIRNARYVRVDNYAPEQIISLGADRWKIYPFHQKSSAGAAGGSQLNHTGTFGWAIRYDGP